jgi:hypothetical protein
VRSALYAEVVSQPRETAIFWAPADNNELGTRNRINEYLRFELTRIHPITKEPGAARLFFVKENDSYPNGNALGRTSAKPLAE